MASYTLGLDIGANSIGWAVVDTGAKPEVVDIGARVFPEGVDRDTKGLEKSKNVARRDARGARRVHQRRRKRREALIKELRRAGLLPEGKEELEKLLCETDPYPLRAKGLDEKLEPYEFGRVLYHLNQRRGFKSNRKSSNKKEEGQIAKEAGQLQVKIDDSRCRTLGEYFASVDPEAKRIRDHYTFRSMYEEEFDLLWNKQATFYPQILTEDFRKRVRDEIIFYQRPLKPCDDFIGDCDLEEDQKRCPRADWYARRFRILQDVNNLRVIDPDGQSRALGGDERGKVLELLGKSKQVSFSTIRKKLGFLESQGFNWEYEVDEKGKKREKLGGDEFCAAMRNKKAFGAKRWEELSEEERIRINEAFVEMEDDELVEFLTAECGLNTEQVDAALKVELPRGYMSFSRKAIRKLLPLMEAGKRPDEALAEVYPERGKQRGELQERLGLPEDVRNPLVNRAMFEVRKVVNGILREYGRPAKIKVEMARDVKGNLRERREAHFKILDNEKRNEEVRKRLKEDINIANPTRDDVIKYKLWEECGKVCPYTGKHISQVALFGPNPEFQVEHILPYDRSLDDSFMNKTLCCVIENRKKADQTPYEFYHGDSEKFEALKQRVNASAMLYWKKKRFWQEEVKTDEIISRELNDTRYITREAVKYLKQVCKNVTGTRGKVTSELAHQWGFIKDRDDHRHHSIDAVITAVTEQKHLRELGRTKYSSVGEAFSPPWPHFREEVLEKVKHINVSHKPRRKVSGALHEETNYGPTGLKDEKGQDVFVYRKPLDALTVAMVDKIVDPVVREIVKQRFIEKGVDLSGSGKPPKEVWAEPLYMKTTKSKKKVLIKKVRIHGVVGNAEPVVDENGKAYRYVKPGSNHHVEIWEYTEGKKRGERDAEVVSMFKAVGRSRSGEAVVKRDHGAGTRFVCSLAINEMFVMPDEREGSQLHRVQKISQNRQIFFQPHTYGGDLKKHPPLSKLPNKLKGHKVTVDPLGQVWPAND